MIVWLLWTIFKRLCHYEENGYIDRFPALDKQFGAPVVTVEKSILSSTMVSTLWYAGGLLEIQVDYFVESAITHEWIMPSCAALTFANPGCDPLTLSLNTLAAMQYQLGWCNMTLNLIIDECVLGKSHD